jgi:signal transduction histidine kinase
MGELAELFEDDLKQNRISLIISCSMPRLTCEKSRIRQVFQNLIDNAIKYMGNGEIREIEIGYEHGLTDAQFFVRDSGVGIHADDLAKIFYIFRRGRNSSEINVPGKGVGLATVKSIIETYDGRITVASQSGGGSMFRFTIHNRFLGHRIDAANSTEESELAEVQ